MAVAMATAITTAPLCLSMGPYVEVPLVNRGVDSATCRCPNEGSNRTNIGLEGILCTIDMV